MQNQKTTPVVNCFACRHFVITHERNFPYACKAVGFKSRIMPSQEMYMNSGMTCQVFEKKDKR